jgi:hypothetical protein
MKQYMMILTEDMKKRLELIIGGGIEFLEVVGMTSVQNGHTFDILMTPSNRPVPNALEVNEATHDSHEVTPSVGI